MIAGIPNQPIDFVGDDLVPCEPDKVSPLLVAQEDDFIFQFTIGRCADAEEFLQSNDFTLGWRPSGLWTFNINRACADNGQGLASLEATGFTCSVGEVYEVEVVVTSIGGEGVQVSLGGVDTIIQSVGTHTFIVTAISNTAFTITLIDDTSSVCLFSAQVYAANTDVEVKLVSDADDELYSTTLDDSPQYFSIEGTTVTAIIPVVDTSATGCFKVFIVDPCVDTYGVSDELCSQTIKLADDCKGTTKLRVCNDHDQPEMGFVAGRFEIRLPALVIRPTFSYDVSEERLSNGYINRQRIDRQEARELRFTDVALGYSTHRFLSALSMFDHFYIGDKEYVVDVGDYQPAYPDTESNTGSVKVDIRPKQELFRKVLCEPVGAGCNPLSDPICPRPNVVIGGSFDGDGLYVYNVVLASMVGFVTDTIQVTVNGTPEPAQDFSTAPNDVEFGPYPAGTTVVLTITNADDPACNWTQTLEVPCECEDAAVSFQLNGTSPASDFFTAANGQAGDYIGCILGKPCWSFAGGPGNGGITMVWTGDCWRAYDENGVGYMSAFGIDYPFPCDVPVWFTTSDGETMGTSTTISVCGGNSQECVTDDCCASGNLIISGAVTIPGANGNVGNIIGIFNGKVYYSASSIAVSWRSSNRWGISVVGVPGLYVSPDNTEYPCQAVNWYYAPTDGAALSDPEDISVCGGQP